MNTNTNKIAVGSQVFFGSKEGYTSKDKDYLILVENPVGFNYRREHSLRGVDTFEYKKMTAQEFVEKTLEYDDALAVGKFLVKEFADAISLTVDVLKGLQPLVEKLDEKHQYERIIFNAIISSESWELSEETIDTAYQSYYDSRHPKQEDKVDETNTGAETVTETEKNISE